MERSMTIADPWRLSLTAVLFVLAAIAPSALADQIRYQGEIRNGTVNQISDENNIYFLDNSGKFYMSFKRSEVEILFASGISDAAKLLKEGRDMVASGKRKAVHGEYQAALQDYEQADRIFRRIRKPAMAEFKEAEAELKRSRLAQSAIRDWAQYEVIYQQAREHIELVNPALMAGQFNKAQQEARMAEMSLSEIQDGPLKATAAQLSTLMENLQQILQQKPDYFALPLQVIALTLENMELGELNSYRQEAQNSLKTMTAECLRNDSCATFFAPWTNILVTALQGIDTTIAQRESSIVSRDTTLAHLEEERRRLAAKVAQDTLDSLIATVPRYTAILQSASQLVESARPAHREPIEKFIATVAADQTRANERLRARQQEAGWICSPVDDVYHPPSPEGLLALLKTDLGGGRFEAAGQWYQRLNADYPKDPLIAASAPVFADLFLQWGDALRDRWAFRDADQKYRVVIDRYPSSPSFGAARNGHRVCIFALMSPYWITILLLAGAGAMALWYRQRPPVVVRRNTRNLAHADGLRLSDLEKAEQKYRRIIRELDKVARHNRLDATGKQLLGRAWQGIALVQLINGDTKASAEAWLTAGTWVADPPSRLIAMQVEHYFARGAFTETELDAFIDYLAQPAEALERGLAERVANHLQQQLGIDEQTNAGAIGMKLNLTLQLATIPRTVPSVVIVEGEGAGRQYPLDARLLIGRSPDNHVILKDPAVNSYQTEISRKDDTYLANNAVPGAVTVVNGRRIEEPEPLQDGARILCGSATLVFYSQAREVLIPGDWIHFNLGMGYLLQNQYTEAAAEFEIARRLNWKNIGAHWKLGQALEQTGAQDDALAAYAVASDLDRTHAGVRHALGMALLARVRARGAAAQQTQASRDRDLEVAIGHLKAAATLAPNNADYFFNLATAYHMARRAKEALIAVQGALLIKPEHPEYKVFLASLQQQLSDPTGVRQTIIQRAVQGRQEATGFNGTVLIVDPSEFPESTIAPTLVASGLSVEVVPDAKLAQEFIARVRPNLVISEIYLPEGDGLDLCRQLKATEATAAIPCIILTAKQEATLAAECLKAGADEFIQKPVDAELLLVKIQRLLQRQTAAPAAAVAGEGGVTGSLRDMSFPELIQVLCAAGKNEEVVVRHADQEARIYIQQGEIIHGAIGGIAGEQSIYEVMKWNEGEFHIKPCSDFPTRTVFASTMSLLMEGARLKDEAGIA